MGEDNSNRSVQNVLIAGGLVLLLVLGVAWWWIWYTTKPSGIVFTPTPSSPRATTRAAPATRATPAMRGAVRPSIRYLNDLGGGNWLVTAGGAVMQANTSGSYIHVSMTSAGANPQNTAAFIARSNALREDVDPALNLTGDQIEFLRNVHIMDMNMSEDDRYKLQQAWISYQQTIANPASTAEAKQTAENSVTQLLATIAAGSMESTRQGYIESANEIRKILTTQQFQALSKPRRATAATRPRT